MKKIPKKVSRLWDTIVNITEELHDEDIHMKLYLFKKEAQLVKLLKENNITKLELLLNKHFDI